MLVGDEGIEDAEIRAGTYRRLLVERLLVGWSLGVAVTSNSLDELDPRVYDEIATLCASQPVGGGKAKTEVPLDDPVAAEPQS
jgi:hypothetical protein